MNRIDAAIIQAENKLRSTGKDAKQYLSNRLDLDMAEYCKFQELKSANMGSKLTLEEAETIYSYLGNSPAEFNKQPVAVKIVLTKVFAELMGVKL